MKNTHGVSRHHFHIEFLATGNELLDGTISDTNSQRLALKIASLGLKIERSQTVPDQREEISETIKAILGRSQVEVPSLIFVSGGLGPTSDDLTLEAVAKFFSVPMIFSKEAEKNVLDRLKRMKRSLANASNLKQAWIPKGAKVLENAEGTAPGVLWEPVPNFYLLFFPGVPREFDHLLDQKVIPWIKKVFKEKITRMYGTHTFFFNLFGWPESEINEYTKTLKIPKGVELGFRTHFPINQLKLMVQSKSQKDAQKRIAGLTKQFQKKFGKALFSRTQDPDFGLSVLQSLRSQRQAVAIAESCTGGMVAHLLTQHSGASEVLDRAFVTYSNQAKMDLLSVNEASLKKYGAVSEEVAREMALGALKHSKAKKSMAITGIAGPSGGTKSKPVGLIYICVAKRGGSPKVIKLNLGFERKMNQIFAAYRGLLLLRDL